MNKDRLPHIGTLLVALSVVGLLATHILFARQVVNTQHRIAELETVIQQVNLPDFVENTSKHKAD